MENKDEYIAYLEDKIIQLEKRLANFLPTEEEVNKMAKEYEADYINDTVGYTVPQTGQYTVSGITDITVRSGAVLTFETLQNAVNAVMRR